MHGLRVLLLGQGRLELDGQALTRLMAPKHQALVFHLAAEAQPLQRGRLATLLWDELDEDAARANLRVALTRLRRWLPDLLEIDARSVGFAPGAPVSVDWWDVRAALRGEGNEAAQFGAADAWRGPLLDGFDGAVGDGYAQWLAGARPRAARDALALRRRLADQAHAAGDLDAAITHARGALEIDDADEAVHMQLMRWLAARGQRTAAIAQYEACRAALAQRLGARPSSECYALYTRIHADRPIGSLPLEPTSGASAPSAPTDAAVPASAARPTLLGRDAELALLHERLAEPECCWLTITGPGGVGKTRLARVAAEQLAPRFRHGWLFVSGREGGGPLRDAETLARHMAERVGADRDQTDALLLVLDNLETVRDARGLVQHVLRRAPGVRVLATSRTRLGGSREWLLELAGLPLARAPDGTPASSPAARLFASCARRLSPTFDPAGEASAIERLCERVGGLPLALELAARGVRLGSVAVIEQRVTEGATLADADRAEDDPHRSIDAVLRSSWELLPPSTRAAAQRLARLAGAVDLALAAAVGVDEADVIALREHSWLRRDERGHLALHPLQQDFVRRQTGADAAAVDDALAAHQCTLLPPVAPFGDLPDDTDVRAAPAALDAPLLAQAGEHLCVHADADRLADWMDRATAWLIATHRHREAAALLRRVAGRSGLPGWRQVGWSLRRAEAIGGMGATMLAIAAYRQTFETLGLDEVAHEGFAWQRLPVAALRLAVRRGWPPEGPARVAFERLLVRALYDTAQMVSLTPGAAAMFGFGALGELLARRMRYADETRRAFTAWAVLAIGRPWLASRIGGRLERPQPIGDARVDAFAFEGVCVVRLGLGRWDGGLLAMLDECALDCRRTRCVRQEMETRSLAAKLCFYSGRLREAGARFGELIELSAQRTGDAWSAWGPLGLVEVGLCLGDRAEALQPLFEQGSRAMTELENTDAGYTVRRWGLAARLALRRGDRGAAREAVLAGVSAAARTPYCGFWAHEGFAGLGDTLLALRRDERAAGSGTTPLEAAWPALEAALRTHARHFLPGRALLLRLRGEHARDDGRRGAAQLLEGAVALAERQGFRVEAARAVEARAAMDSAAGWQDRAARLWREMSA